MKCNQAWMQTFRFVYNLKYVWDEFGCVFLMWCWGNYLYCYYGQFIHINWLPVSPFMYKYQIGYGREEGCGLEFEMQSSIDRKALYFHFHVDIILDCHEKALWGVCWPECWPGTIVMVFMRINLKSLRRQLTTQNESTTSLQNKRE